METLRGLDRRPGDELIIADNTSEGIVPGVVDGRVEVVPAAGRRSASYARNAGAARATNEWLLFIDADCVPPAGLLDQYFAAPPGPRCGVVAGEVAGAPDQDALLARWTRSRRGLWVRHHLSG
ncbi:MAG: glycosyltransferase, partial [Actinomycetota bacterium]|nr:glycosyltransferase [Actinomycetota bacterium]